MNSQPYQNTTSPSLIRNQTVTLFSEPNFFAVNILEQLLSKNCFVNIITKETKKWEEKTKHLNRDNFLISSYKKIPVRRSDYTIFCSGFLSIKNTYDDLYFFNNKVNVAGSRVIAVFPFESYYLDSEVKPLPNENTSIIYVGDLLGPRIDLDSDLLTSSLMFEILTKRSLSLGVGETFYPMFVSDASKIISKWMFSFGPYGKQVFLLGPPVSATNYWKANKDIVDEVKLKYVNDMPIRPIPKDFEVVRIEADLKYCLTETFKWFVYKDDKSVAKKDAAVKPLIPIKLKVPKKVNKRLRTIIRSSFLVLTILVFPLLINAAGWGMFYFFYRQHFVDQKKDRTNSVLIAKTLFAIGKNSSLVFTNIPVIGRVYKESAFASTVGTTSSEMILSASSAVNDGIVLFNNILGDKPYDSAEIGKNIKVNVDFLYRELSLMQSETQDGIKSGLFLPSYLSEKVNFEKYKNMLVQGSVLAENLPDILGKGQKKTYLVLFQNNMELRPTGGFIGSYGVLSLDSGRLNELNVNDVYSADGQLKGHVEPPAPLKEHLGQANWWLRDSNWDPDFPTSAQRAEWFLNKETDQQVDGVVALDLDIVKDILSFTGPIFLPDYNLTISDKNLYETTQSEVQDNFFPGTHKKASFLTALSRQLLFEIGKTEGKNKGSLLKAFVENLDERHIQAYFHSSKLEDPILMLGWGGAVGEFSCGEDCYQDSVGLVEANLGFNKSNYFISRKVGLSVNMNKENVIRTLNVNYHNSASPVLGPSGRYGVYLRVVLPPDTNSVTVSKVSGDNEEQISPEITMVKNRKEAGIWLTVLPEQDLDVKFIWKSDIPENTQLSGYGIYIRKQAGVSDDPWSINLGFTLTKPESFRYNTILTKDFYQKIFIK
ncbi:MAG: DUF4012 domain-containing protein [Candidatus Woesebacteria bacterium]|nr:MAG: DUF4012 domain-containing protein [Candidatus Woesebacteria bacterium]